jgi:ABC-2 type transport system permease protein
MQDALMYRSQSILWMLTDVVAAIIMPFVWLSSYHGRETIQGFAPDQMVLYYLTMAFLANLVVAHVQWEVSRDVKDGTLSKYLLYPFSYLQFHYMGNLSYRVLRCFYFIPFLILWLIVFRNHLSLQSLQHLHVGPEFLLALVLGHFVAFFFAWVLGSLAFYFIETASLFLAYYIFLHILGGQIAPFQLLPPLLQTIATYTPFRYTLSFPLEVLHGRVQGAELWTGIAIQAFWLITLYLIGRVAWRAGTKQYAGAGM